MGWVVRSYLKPLVNWIWLGALAMGLGGLISLTDRRYRVGARLGYAIWPKELVEGVTRLAINCHSCVNAPTQYAGIAALTGPQQPARDMVAAFEARRSVVIEELNALPGVSCIEPGGAFYAFPNITGTGIPAKELEARLLEEAGVASVAGTSFGAHGEGYLRISYANSVDNIREAMGRVRTWLETRAAA